MAFSLALCVLGAAPDVLKQFRSENQKDLEIEDLKRRLDLVTKKLSDTCNFVRSTSWLNHNDGARNAITAHCSN
jgi:hypothetical protein